MTVATDMKVIPITDLHPWSDNPRPRARKNDDDDKQLIASVQEHGVLQSLVVRPHGKGFLIVCGERRYRAALAAGIPTVPANIRELSDSEALAIALTENLQRKDMHPADEAAAIARLQKSDKMLRTPAALAAKLGVPESHIRRRLRLERLAKPVREAFLADALTVQHAELLAQLDEKLQVTALEESCYHELWANDVKAALKKDTPESWTNLRDHIAPIAMLREFIESNRVIDVQDEDVQQEIPELQGLVKSAAETGTKIVQLSETHYSVPKGLVGKNDWRPVPKKKCPATKRGVIAHGGPARIVDYCDDKKCKTHWPELQPAKHGKAPEPPRMSAAAQKAEDARKARERKWNKLKRAVMPALVKAILAHAKADAELVKEVLGSYGVRDVQDRTGVKLTDANAVGFLALSSVVKNIYHRGQLTAAAKRFKFDVAKFERDLAKSEKAAKKAKGKK